MLLIVGIDPGTTVGYAVLTLNRELKFAGSKKEFSLDLLIQKITSHGLTLIVGCDKAKIPGFIERFAVKTGSKIFYPKNDLKTDEKRQIVSSYAQTHIAKFKNAHEMDALASALFAYKKFEPLISRVKRNLARTGKENLFEPVVNLVVRKGLSIAGAIELLEQDKDKTKKGNKIEDKIIKKVLEEKKFVEQDFIKLFNGLVDVQEQNKRLKKQITKSNRENRRLKSKLNYFKKKIEQISPEEKALEQLRFKEEKLIFLENELVRKKEQMNNLESEFEKLNLQFSKINDVVVTKKLKNLGWKEFEYKNKIVNVIAGDVLFVDDANEFSEKTLKHLKEKVEILIVRKKISAKNKQRLISNFAVIESNKLDFEEERFFVFVNKKSFEKARKNRELLKSIVEEYKQGRL